jgi:hypothetical protein
MYSKNWFSPDFSRHGYVASVPRLHGALRFTYQPALVLERAELRAADFADPQAGLVRRVAAMLPNKLFAWDLAGGDGALLPITAENILRIHPTLFEKFYRVVFGLIPTDVDPQWPADVREELEADSQAAESAGVTIGELREERDSKNLSGG